MEKALEWSRHLIEEVARRRHTDMLYCAHELRVLMQVAVGEKPYQEGDLEELVYILTGSRPAQATNLDEALATESQIAIHAHKIATTITQFDEAYQTERSTSGRFLRFLSRQPPRHGSLGQRLVEHFHYLCQYLKVDQPELEPHEVKHFLKTVIGAMPQSRASEQSAP